MKTRITLSAALLLASAAFSVVAQSSTSTQYLLPVFVPADSPIPGANGSRWVTHLTIANRGTSEVFLVGIIGCGVLQPVCPPNAALLPGRTLIDPSIPEASGAIGHLFSVSGDAGSVDFVLRAQDVSRQSHTWGTVLPAVPEHEFLSRDIGLPDILITPEFRSLVRIYDLQTSGARQVKVSVYSTIPNQPDVLVADYLVPFLYHALPSSREAVYEPGYAEFSLWNRPELNGYDRVRVVISPENEDLRFWAFAAVTNNETQHVTAITPTRR